MQGEAGWFATLEWVDWFNNRRLLGPIGNIPGGFGNGKRQHAHTPSPNYPAFTNFAAWES